MTNEITEADRQAAADYVTLSGNCDSLSLVQAFSKHRIAALQAREDLGESVEPVAEIVLFGGNLKEVAWRKGKMPPAGTKLYDHPSPAELPGDALRECPLSPDGRHHVDTSMESGPNNCFHCEQPMPRRSALATKGDGE